jgi:zinc protease
MIAALVLAQLAAAAPPVRFELSNGLRVWVQEDHSRPIALVQITYKVGSLHEGPGTTGIAHFVEHMVYRATERIRNEDVYGYIDRIGGRYTGGTWPEMTRYAETVPSWALESALRVTAERMCCALFDSLEFERERSNVVTEANGFSETDAVAAFRDALMSAAFELHPYRYNSNTWARDNLLLTRTEAYGWYKRHYGPNNAVLVIVGDVSADNVRTLVEKHFGGLPRAPASGEIALVEPPQVAEKRVVVRHDSAAQELQVLYHAPAASHPDFPTLVVLNRALSRRLVHLFERDSTVGEFWVKDSSAQYPYVYRFTIPTTPVANLDSVLARVQGEIDRLAATGLSDEELRMARSEPGTLTRELALAGSSGMPPRRSRLTRAADELTEREALDWEVGPSLRDRIRAATASVTSAQVQAFARRWLRPHQRTVGFLVSSAAAPAPSPRTAIPPLRTPPAKRLRPEPVPPRALEPLAPVRISTTRRELPNGVVVRTASVSQANGAPFVVVSFTDARDSAAVARQLVTPVIWRRRGAPPPRDTADVRVLAAVAPAARDTARGAVVVAVVGARPEEISRTLGARLAQLPAFRRQLVRDGAPAIDATEVRLALSGKTQVEIVAGLPGVPRHHPDRRALELLNYIVGVPSYGGRLGWALTKVGLTYASAATTSFGPRSGHILFSTTSDTDNANASIQAIREVIEGVGTRGVEEWELREAQAFTLGRTLLYGAREDSDPIVIANALIDSEDSGLELLDLPALSRAYLGVTLAEINRVARRYYRPRLLKVVAAGAVPRDSTSAFAPGTFRALFEP